MPLPEAGSEAQAFAKLQKLLTQRRKGTLPVLKRTPLFTDYAEQYFDCFVKVKDAKRASTLYTECISINHWIEHRGLCGWIASPARSSTATSPNAKRQAAGCSGRTVNLEVMKRAVDDGWLNTLPTLNLRPLKCTPQKRGRLVESSPDI